MPTEYLKYICKTCGVVSSARAANAPLQDGAYYLHCECGHQTVYEASEIERLELESPPEIRRAFGLD